MKSFQQKLSRRAPAKLNLWLAVHGRREDGYHELTTLMAALELADELSVESGPEPGVQLELRGPQATPDIPTDSRNLVCRAGQAVLERSRELGLETAPGLKFLLTKQIPSQAGLGGGSSDAAAALNLAQAVLGVDLGADWCRQTLTALGADCVFFHELGPSGLGLCEGIGERVTPWQGATPAWTVALVVPRAPCPTGTVFAALQLGEDRQRSDIPLAPGFQEQGCESIRERLHNDLEVAALSCVPELGAWRAFLDRNDAGHFRLSGSGSSFYGLFDESEEAEAEIGRLRALAGKEGLESRLLALSGLGAGLDPIG